MKWTFRKIRKAELVTKCHELKLDLYYLIIQMNRQIQDDALYNDKREEEEKKTEWLWKFLKIMGCILVAELLCLCFFLRTPVFEILFLIWWLSYMIYMIYMIFNN